MRKLITGRGHHWHVLIYGPCRDHQCSDIASNFCCKPSAVPLLPVYGSCCMCSLTSGASRSHIISLETDKLRQLCLFARPSRYNEPCIEFAGLQSRCVGVCLELVGGTSDTATTLFVCMQIATLQAEVPEATLPYDVSMPHTDLKLSAHRAMCFTQERLVNTFTLTQTLSRSTDTSTPSGKRARNEPQSGQSTEVADDGTVSAAAAVAAVAEVCNAQSPEAKGSKMLAEILTGEPRSRVSCQEAADLIAAMIYYLARPVIKHLPAYLQPLLEAAPMDEVRAVDACHRCHSA